VTGPRIEARITDLVELIQVSDDAGALDQAAPSAARIEQGALALVVYVSFASPAMKGRHENSDG
jgi:hypothetical protein